MLCLEALVMQLRNEIINFAVKIKVLFTGLLPAL